MVISKAGIAGRYLRSQQGSSNEYAFDVAFDAQATQAEVRTYVCMRERVHAYAMRDTQPERLSDNSGPD